MDKNESELGHVKVIVEGPGQLIPYENCIYSPDTEELIYKDPSRNCAFALKAEDGCRIFVSSGKCKLPIDTELVFLEAGEKYKPVKVRFVKITRHQTNPDFLA